jgi:hypothetical protein
LSHETAVVIGQGNVSVAGAPFDDGRGEAAAKPREKCTRLTEMLHVLGN